MKKSLLSLAVVAVALNSIASAQLLISDVISDGQPIVDNAYTQLLNDYDSSRWYTDASTISCEVSDEWISIVSPIISDSFFDEATEYRLFLSPYRVSQLKSWDPSINLSNIITKDVKADANAENITFDISSADVDPDGVYYGFITPLDMYDVVWTPSRETCFQINGNLCMRDEACDAIELVVNPVAQDETVVDEEHWSADDEHGASCVGMDLANVSHTVSNNAITLRWTAVDGDIVQIAIFDPNEEIYKSLGSAKMSDERFTYAMQRDWEQNFMLTNGCKEVYYKADAAKKSEPTIVTPATWPAENMLIIAIAAIVLYGAYTLVFRKSENK